MPRLFHFTMLGAVVALFFPPISAQGPVHLGQWESVEPTQLSQECSGSNRAVIEGDFDGDGQRDRAALLVNRSKNRLSVFVHVGGKLNAWQPVLVLPSGTPAREICLQLIMPGSYKTACGLSHDRGHNVNCRLGEPENIELKTNGIGVHLKQRETLFYWDKNTKRFSELLMKQ